ncbi:unnamed protein product [Thlaspi arvense]|uniref:F-box domain-containing protein n=1 Tax=Thlaspi arvense TaxID=13288 RepID=A0AAU9S1H0_THLAR|nr:unnamed protein product [Thlaspi arvense]
MIMEYRAMKRVRREETIGNNRQCEESDKKDPFSILPMDLRVEILLRIPAKSRARMVLVSKQWLSMLCGKDLTNLYLARSSTRKRLLFAVCRTYVHEMFLQSISQKDPSNSEDHHKVNIPRHPRRLGALSTGELIFSPYSFTTSFYFISYDLKSHHAKKVVVEEIGDHLSEIQVYVDHIESPMFLPNLNLGFRSAFVYSNLIKKQETLMQRKKLMPSSLVATGLRCAAI